MAGAAGMAATGFVRVLLVAGRRLGALGGEGGEGRIADIGVEVARVPAGVAAGSAPGRPVVARVV